jgi:hypothetical protein
MLKNHEIMRYFELYRLEHKVPIYKITKGIMSTRNYSRVLSGEVDISLEDYARLLRRLRLPLFEFNNYIENSTIDENIHEIQFLQAVECRNFEKAYQIIKPYLRDRKWKTMMAIKTIPIAIKLMESQLKQCTTRQFYDFARQTLELTEMETQKFLSFDDFEALLLYSHYGTVEEQRRIYAIFYRIMRDEVRILSTSLEYSMSRLHLRTLELATSFHDPDDSMIEQLREIAWIVLEYQSRAKMIGVEAKMLLLLHRYYQANHIPSETLLSDVALSVLGSSDETMIQKWKAELSNTEIAWIKNHILPSKLPIKHFLEEVSR